MKTRKTVLSEEKLIEAISNRNSIGIEALYDMYSASLLGIIVKIVINKEVAEDTLQDTFIKIWNCIERYDATKGRFFTWMVTIARNNARDILRSKNHKQYLVTSQLEEVILNIDESEQVLMNVDVIGVKLLLHYLRKEEQAVFDLLYYKGYSHSEVAEVLQIPLGTVKTRWRSGIKVLRSIYNQVDQKAGECFKAA